MKKQGLFVTGTDTGIGKTFISNLLMTALQGMQPGYIKPIQTGKDWDEDAIEGEIAPSVYSFSDPMAPSRAAQKAHEVIDLDRIRRAWDSLDDRPWVIEGVGGVLVPLNQCQTVRDLIVTLGVPALLVASTRLGTINHTLLSLEALERAHIPLVGIVLNGDKDLGLAETLQDFTQVPIVEATPQVLRGLFLSL